MHRKLFEEVFGKVFRQEFRELFGYRVWLQGLENFPEQLPEYFRRDPKPNVNITSTGGTSMECTYGGPI